MNGRAMRSRRRRGLPRQRPKIWPVTIGRRENVVRRPTADCQFRSRSYAPGSLSSLLLTLMCAHTYYVLMCDTCILRVDHFPESYLPGFLAGRDKDSG